MTEPTENIEISVDPRISTDKQDDGNYCWWINDEATGAQLAFGRDLETRAAARGAAQEKLRSLDLG